MEDLDRAISELSYALDVLHADGVTLFTRYGNENYYLGHPNFIPLWTELNKRQAAVFVHPTTGIDIGLINPLLPAPMIEYPHETTRCAVDLVVSKRVRENPDWKIVFMPFRGHSSVHRNASWSTAFPCKFLVCYS